jgi:hypothetical protein
MSEETTNTKKSKTTATKVTIQQFLGIISIDKLNRFVVERMYAKNEDLKTPTSWDKELKGIKGLNYIYKP